MDKKDIFCLIFILSDYETTKNLIKTCRTFYSFTKDGHTLDLKIKRYFGDRFRINHINIPNFEDRFRADYVNIPKYDKILLLMKYKNINIKKKIKCMRSEYEKLFTGSKYKDEEFKLKVIMLFLKYNRAELVINGIGNINDDYVMNISFYVNDGISYQNEIDFDVFVINFIKTSMIEEVREFREKNNETLKQNFWFWDLYACIFQTGLGVEIDGKVFSIGDLAKYIRKIYPFGVWFFCREIEKIMACKKKKQHCNVKKIKQYFDAWFLF